MTVRRARRRVDVADLIEFSTVCYATWPLALVQGRWKSYRIEIVYGQPVGWPFMLNYAGSACDAGDLVIGPRR